MGKGSALLRDKRVWWTAGTVAVLAAVILVVAAISAPKQSALETKKPSPEIQAESLAKQAETALSNGETSTAVALAEQALEEDTQNQTAKRVIEQAESPQQNQTTTNNGDSSDETSTPVAQDQAYSKAVADMTTLLPVSVKDWSKGTVVKQKSEALVTFEPNSGNAAGRSTVRALVIAHDRGTSAKAQAFITKVDKRVYTKDKTSVDLGAVNAYFASDGTKLAVVAFARGRYAFEVILTAQPRVKPGTLKEAAVVVASRLPAAK